jgi:hypothetical protein
MSRKMFATPNQAYSSPTHFLTRMIHHGSPRNLEAPRKERDSRDVPLTLGLSPSAALVSLESDIRKCSRKTSEQCVGIPD